VLTSAYQWYATALNGKGEPIIVPTSRASNPEGTVMSRSLANTVQELTASGARVVVVTPHPELTLSNQSGWHITLVTLSRFMPIMTEPDEFAMT
jgi:hypothetical protein